jgi:hypothetical protein
MDSAITTSIETLLTGVMSAMYGYNYIGSIDLNAPVIMSYGGASLSFFFSLAGAYSMGAKLVESTETGYFTFLEDF